MSAALANPATPSSHILAAIRALRQARQAATTEVEAAKQDLASVLTVRQEGLLLQFGVL